MGKILGGGMYLADKWYGVSPLLCFTTKGNAFAANVPAADKEIFISQSDIYG